MAERVLPPIPDESDPTRSYYDESMGATPSDLAVELSQCMPVEDDEAYGAAVWLGALLQAPSEAEVMRSPEFYAERRVAIAALVYRLTDALEAWPAIPAVEDDRAILQGKAEA